MKKGQRGQAALELLMITVLALTAFGIVMWALSHYGIYYIQDILPEKCSLQAGMSCADYDVGTNGIAFLLRNGPRDIRITSIAASSEALGTSVNLGCACTTGPIDVLLTTSQAQTFSLTIPECPNYCDYRDTGRKRNKYNMTVYYSLKDSPTITHKIEGELIAKKE